VKSALLVALAAACAPDLGPPDFLVDRPRVIAVQSVPPEVAPGASAAFHLLAVGPSGPLDVSSAGWAFCTAPLPLTESGTVASACEGTLPQIALGAAPSIATSPDACGLFGSVPSSVARRPRNPDATGGYFQPVRVQVSGATAFAQERLLCPLTQASLSVSLDFQRRYTPNQNPVITAFSGPTEVSAGQQVLLTISWDQGSVETYPVFDPAHLQIVDTAEVMTVSWYATAGTLLQDRSGATGLSATNTWIAPSSGTVFLWAVLHDSRGGLDMASLQATVAQ
jgi:hypothetical protein